MTLQGLTVLLSPAFFMLAILILGFDLSYTHWTRLAYRAYMITMLWSRATSSLHVLFMGSLARFISFPCSIVRRLLQKGLFGRLTHCTEPFRVSLNCYFCVSATQCERNDSALISCINDVIVGTLPRNESKSQACQAPDAIHLTSSIAISCHLDYQRKSDSVVALCGGLLNPTLIYLQKPRPFFAFNLCDERVNTFRDEKRYDRDRSLPKCFNVDVSIRDFGF